MRTSIVGLAAAMTLGVAGVHAQPAPDPATTYVMPPGTQVTVDRRTGRVSFLMPSEIEARAAGDPTFAAWRKTAYPGTGPSPAVRTEDPTLPTHTLYHPATFNRPLPVVLWANGGCRNTSVEFTRFLGEVASRGYFVVAVGRNDVPFALFGPRDPQPGPGEPPLQIRGGEVVLAGLDWLMKETARKGSPYYGKADITKVAALGQSCGGSQVWAAARDTRVKAVAAMNSNFPSARSGVGPGGAPPTDGWTVEKLTIPAAFFIGGPGDSAYPPSLASYAATPAEAVVVKANLPVAGHTGAYAGPNMDWVAAVTGWLDWQLKGDPRGKALFAGPACGLCGDPKWWIEAKNVN